MRLFSDYDLRKILESHSQKMKEKIDCYSNDEIMANNLELLADNCFEEYKIEPVIIGEEEFNKRSIVQQKIQKRIEPFFRDVYQKDYVEVDGIVAKFFSLFR